VTPTNEEREMDQGFLYPMKFEFVRALEADWAARPPDASSLWWKSAGNDGLNI
jgi:hypothetical protein